MSEGDTNPFLDMGLLGMMQPNKYLNPAYAGQSLKLPGYYTGVAGSQAPTDAAGKPIQSFVDANATKQAQYQKDLAAYNAGGGGGTTLNSVPTSGLDDLRAQVNQGVINSANANLDSSIAAGTAPGYSGRGAETGIANYPGAVDAIIGLSNYRQQLGTPDQGSSSGGSPPTPPDLRQDYLTALSRPQGDGKMPMVGANVPQSQPLGVPSVMASFLAAHPGGGGKGAGAYDNSPFFSTLNKLGTA